MSIYNADEIVAPSWINQEFLEKVLTEYEQKDGVVILKFDLSPASMKGDHYASVMFRCKVDYRFGCLVYQKSFVIKTIPTEDGAKRELLTESKLFETEIDMYTKTLPKIEKILARCGEPTKLAAEIIYSSLEPHKVLVFQDLCESGYDVIRGRFLQEDEIKSVYRKIAKLHAVSYMLGHSENHEEVTKYQEGVFSISVDMIKDMLRNGLENFLNMLSFYDEFDLYYEKFKAMKPDIEQACKDMFNAYNLNKGLGDIFVLNHGDFHMKNLMFKFNRYNQMEDVIMVDYQISCYAPSAIDMIYSQYMMLSTELRAKRHELMLYYFTEFIKTLKKINYQDVLPKFSDFQIAGIKYRHFTLFLVSTFLPMVTGILSKPMEEWKNIDTAEVFENPDVIAEIYRTPAFVDEIRQLMPILLRDGYLD